MPDVVDAATRSRMMSGIGPRNTAPEIAVRSFLHAAGFRFRLHARHLPGKPDLVLKRLGTVVFVHGCFWHQHPGCRFAVMPKNNAKFWAAKLGGNRERDARQIEALRRAGWKCEVIWECKASDGKALKALAIRLGKRRRSNQPARGRGRKPR